MIDSKFANQKLSIDKQYMLTSNSNKSIDAKYHNRVLSENIDIFSSSSKDK